MTRRHLRKARASNETPDLMTKRAVQIRAQPLSVLQQVDGPMSAVNEGLDCIKAFCPTIAQQAIYSALTRLTEAGRVHGAESPQSYITCQGYGPRALAVLSMCDARGTVKERSAPSLIENLSRFVGETGFTTERHVIEVHSLCASCGSDT